MARKKKTSEMVAAPLDPVTLRNLKNDVSPEGLLVMLGVFKHELAERVERMEVALANADENVLERESHLLTSIAGQFGAFSLQNAASQIHDFCKRNDYRAALRASRDIGELGRKTLVGVDRLLEEMS